MPNTRELDLAHEFTESEAWEYLASEIELHQEVLYGLCYEVDRLKKHDRISIATWLNMLDRIEVMVTKARREHRAHSSLLDRFCDSGDWLFRPGEWQPRVELARRFAEESANVTA